MVLPSIKRQVTEQHPPQRSWATFLPAAGRLSRVHDGFYSLPDHKACGTSCCDRLEVNVTMPSVSYRQAMPGLHYWPHASHKHRCLGPLNPCQRSHWVGAVYTTMVRTCTEKLAVIEFYVTLVLMGRLWEALHFEWILLWLGSIDCAWVHYSNYQYYDGDLYSVMFYIIMWKRGNVQILNLCTTYQDAVLTWPIIKITTIQSSLVAPVGVRLLQLAVVVPSTGTQYLYNATPRPDPN